MIHGLRALRPIESTDEEFPTTHAEPSKNVHHSSVGRKRRLYLPLLTGDLPCEIPAQSLLLCHLQWPPVLARLRRRTRPSRISARIRRFTWLDTRTWTRNGDGSIRRLSMSTFARPWKITSSYSR